MAGFEEHNHGACEAHGLAVAEATCVERGVQLTPARRRVLEILLEAHEAMGAYDVLERLAAEGLGDKPPVAYRALAFLCEQGFAHRIERLNAFVACAHPGDAHDPAFMICRGCGTVAEGAADGVLKSSAKATGFVIEQRVVEVEGLCPGCRDVSLIAVEDVAVSYGSARVLHDVSLSVARGEIVTLVGPNGSGKSTLLRVLIGALKPTKGRVMREAGLRIGYVPQKLALDATLPMTVRRFLDLPVRVSESEAEAALERAGAGGLAARQMVDLSGGQFQRVLLARAVLLKPDVLILDEPTQGLDQPGQAAFYRQIEAVKAELGCAVLMVSHELHVVMSASDRVICLNGHVCCEGTPDVVQAAPAYRELFGSGTGGALALYRHEHSHSHDHDHDHSHGEH